MTELDLPTGGTHDLSDDREAEPIAGMLGFHAYAGIQHSAAIVCRNPRSVIVDDDLDMAVGSLYQYRPFCVPARVTLDVDEKIVHHLPEPGGIDRCVDRLGRQVDAQTSDAGQGDRAADDVVDPDALRRAG